MIRQDDFCTVYEGSSPDGDAIIKQVADSGLAMNEVFVLNSLNNDEADPRFIPYLPKPLKYGDDVLVFRKDEGFVTLEDVITAYPDGLDPRDMAWMYRRLLVALGFAHQGGYVHGAVLPQNVLIHPEMHGLILVGWCHATTWDPADAPNELMSTYPGYANWYGSKKATPHLDIQMAALIGLELVANDLEPLPREYKTYFDGATTHMDDAWTALEYFDTLLARLYGRRTFRPFSMP